MNSIPLSVESIGLLMVGVAWLAVAVWAVIRSARIEAQAQIAQAWGLRLRGLLATSQVAYLIVGDDRKIIASDRLRSWLSLDGAPSTLSDLAIDAGSGIEAGHYEDLEAAIEAAAVSGTPFVTNVRTAVGGRVLRAEGVSAPPEVAGERGVVVWLSDQSEDAEREQRVESQRREELTRSEAARRMIAVAPVPIWRRDAGLKLTEVNAAYAAAVECPTPALAVENGAELLTGSAIAMERSAAKRAIESGDTVVHEETTVVGGRRAKLRIYDVPLQGGQVAGFAIDVTDLADARTELKRVVTTQDRLFEQLSVGVARFDGERQLVYANPAFLRIFKFEERLVEERPEFQRVLERMRDARRLPEQRDFPDWKRERLSWFTSTDVNIEETWVLPDNEVLRVFAQPSHGGGLTIIFEDESERLRLASSRDQLARVQDATLQNLMEAVAVFSSSGRLEFHNRAFAKLWQITPNAIEQGKQIDEIFSAARVGLADGDIGEQMRTLVRSATDGRAQRSGRFELTGQRYVRFAAVPLPDGNALFTFDDITDSERVEMALRDRNEALEAADRTKSQFVENMSYELRTPLTAISGFGQMLSAGMAGELTSQQVDYIESILTSAGRLGLMIDSIIDLANSDGGDLSIDPQDVAISDLIESCRGMVDGLADDKNIAIRTSVEKGAEHVFADPVRMRQAVYNLLTNAVRYTSRGGHIDVSVAAEGSWLELRVADDGIGIPEDDLPRVFERFYKGSNARASAGFGLGLSIVKEVAAAHGGTAEVHSDDGGTLATLKLPLRQTPPIANGGAGVAP